MGSSQHKPQPPQPEIATWLNKGHAEQLMKAAQQYWSNTKDWVMWAVAQKDEQQSEEPFLGLLAWERLTERLPFEPAEFFRKRVQHALVNSVDAGEIATIEAIFNRLGIDVIKVSERIDNRDWDIIAIDFSSHTVSKYGELMPELIQLYGRTCRRYEFTVHSVVDVGFAPGWLDVQWDSVHVDLGLALTQGSDIEFNPMSGFLGGQYNVQNVPLLPLNMSVEHPLTLQPLYGFLSKESSISTATE
ncbi:putative bacteriophage protein [Moritella sp. PE36]|uniref:hypothetical protein n=1 Tax=Moritella sp. PE36 TaxID=58051 RepID=UPI00015682F7|nr:hypothetical protein [Moritella sp. PE36]EDM67054.1 putative bacteriophage protein [Moritella sp. PE36]